MCASCCAARRSLPERNRQAIWLLIEPKEPAKSSRKSIGSGDSRGLQTRWRAPGVLGRFDSCLFRQFLVILQSDETITVTLQYLSRNLRIRDSSIGGGGRRKKEGARARPGSRPPGSFRMGSGQRAAVRKLAALSCRYIGRNENFVLIARFTQRP